MRVLLDCRSVFPSMGGIGRATAALASHLPPALTPGDELLLLLGTRRPGEGQLCLLRREGVEVQALPSEASMLDPAFEQLELPGLLRRYEVDLVHMTCFTSPVAAERVARVSTVHDVVFRRRPELVEPWLREYLDLWTGVSCRIADAVLTPSGFSRDEIMACYGRPSSVLAPALGVVVVENGVEARFRAIQRRPSEGAPFLLYVGALEPKKNVPALLHAFARLLERAPSLPHILVLAGGRGGQELDLERALKEAGPARQRVRVMGHVPEEQLLALYARADAFLYLSEYEGFGLPPLEAMAAGVPTVVADRASLPEVVGDAAIRVDPADTDQVAGELQALLTDTTRQADLARRGRGRAAAFTWERAAARTVEVYRAALERERGRREQAPLRVLAAPAGAGGGAA